MAQLFDTGIFSVTDGIEPGSGWKLGWYLAGTATLTNSYSDPSLDPLTVNTNPVIADGNGRFPAMWLGAGSYKYALLDADGVPVPNGTRDNWTVSAAPPSFSAALNNFLAGTAPLPIANGGTASATAPNAISALGGLPAAGGPVTGEITRATKGAYLYNAASGMAKGAVFITATATADPTGNAGEWWLKY